MVDVSSQNNSVSINVSSSGNSASIKASPDTALYYSEKSREWAISDRIVDGKDYSSKYYANKSAISESNAKGYAQSSQDAYNQFQQSVDVALSNVDTAVQGAVESINTKSVEAIDNINSTKTTILRDIEFVADGERQEIEDLADLIKDNAQEIANRTSFAMFDTILKDHVLTYEESKGLALQGTYVYKEAVAGSRYGYPDFYNKVVEEFNESTVTPTWLKNNVTFVGGSFTDNYIFNGASGAYMQLPETAPLNTADSWEFKTRYTYDGGGTYPCILGTSDTTHYHNLHIIVNSGTLTVYLSGNGSSWNIANSVASTLKPVAGTTYYLKIGFTGDKYYVDYNTDGSDTYTNCFELASTAKVYSSNPLMLMNEGNDTSKYYNNGSMDLSQTSLTIDGAVWWKGADFYNIYKNSNGHTFFNITEKELIDDIFASTGVAWLYGVDTENERVFLPRNNYFEQVTGNSSEVGQSIEAGLPNITGTIDGVLTAGSSAFKYKSSPNAGTPNASWSNPASKRYDFDASLSNSIYGNSDTVQPNAVKKLLYICVGNTESVSSVTDVVEVTTTENDTTPLFTAQYFDFTPNNVSWLKAGQQKNNEGIYRTCYNELVKCLNEADNIYNLKVINEADMIAGVDYSEFWKVNQDNMTFTTPTAISLKAYNSIAPVVGNGYALGISNGTYNEGCLEMFDQDSNEKVRAFRNGAGTLLPSTAGGTTLMPHNTVLGVSTDPSLSGIEAHLQENPNAQLYFKVANAVQNLELLDAGEVLEAVADKISRQDCPAYIVETYVNGTSWYRVYSDGWCEQGGRGALNETATVTVTLLKPYKDTNYSVSAVSITASTASDNETGLQCTPISTTQITLTAHYLNPNTQTACWEAKGYIA